ncbi:MAG TPA: M1 family metallopeptidase [Nitrososphaeraceae archaeon]
MQTEHKSPKTFAFPGSTTHYLSLLPFDIEYMALKLKPDFESKTLANCEEILQIIARREITEIELDIAEMKIDKVLYCDSIDCYNKNTNNFSELNFDTNNDKLIVKFANKLLEGKSMTLVIKYSAGYRYVDSNLVITKPRSGFHFVEYDEYHRKTIGQAWTQGETTESKYWFPCIDQPQAKYPREIEVLTPANVTVISNGIEKSKSRVEILQDNNNDSKKLIRHTWEEKIPNPAYLTSVVIGTFSRKDEEYLSSRSKRKINLSYFWPLDFDHDYGVRNFQNTPRMIKYFEEFLDSPYPYDKYSQVTVEGFELGGMENTSCTTLTRNILYDERGSLDYTSDDVISHELAHQWFGDLITCKDWSHIWLNEGFATYFEALYREASRGIDEFQNYILQMADSYLDEASTLYKRSIVTKVYKHPDELFDSHSYKKGGCILHMLRNYLGYEIFKKSLKTYVDTYKTKSAKTDDLRKIFEYVSGKSLEQFFDQWVYGAGHPELDIEFSQDTKNIKFKITQVQDGTMFEFGLEIVLVYQYSADDGTTQEKRLNETIKISEKVTEKSFEIPLDDKGSKMKIKTFSIDPHFKVLKEIKSTKAPEDLLITQLEHGDTIFSKVNAARALKDKFSDDVVNALKNLILNQDTFWAVSVEVANTLGSYYTVNDYIKTNKAYSSLVDCFSNGIKNSKSRRAVVRNIGIFEKEDSIDLLVPLVEKQIDPSYFVEGEAATALGKSCKHILDKTKKQEIISILKNVAERTDTFRNIPARWAIDGLKHLFKDDDKQIISEIMIFLIDKTKHGNHDLVRRAATPALGKFLLDKDKKFNSDVFERLKDLLRDERSLIRTSACTAFADPDAKPLKPDVILIDILNQLTFVAGHDIDGFTRRAAETSFLTIKDWIKEWSETPSPIALDLREKEDTTAYEEKIKKHQENALTLLRKDVLVNE